MKFAIQLCSFWFICLCIGFLNCSKYIEDLKSANCMDPLFSNTEVNLTSSSVYAQNNEIFKAHNARMETINDQASPLGAAWCPADMIMNETKQWITADFGSVLRFFSTIFTIGRGGKGNFNEYVPYIIIKYQRGDSDSEWKTYGGLDNKQIIKANENTDSLQRIDLKPFILANRISIYPYNEKTKRMICLRFSLYGCNSIDGVVEYLAPQGDSIIINGAPYDFKDHSYDGKKAGNRLSGGVGQLTDGIMFTNKPTEDSDEKKGFHFVGWNRNPGFVMALTFKFDTVREFSSVKFSIYNDHSNEIGVFSHLQVEFSVGGRWYDSQTSVNFSYPPDKRMTGVRQIDVPLKKHYGRFVRLTLTFSAKNLLLSEIHFKNEVMKIAVPVETNFPLPGNDGEDTNGKNSQLNDPFTNPPRNTPSNNLFIAMIAVIVLLIVLATLFIIWWRCQPLRNKKKQEACHSGVTSQGVPNESGVNLMPTHLMANNGDGTYKLYNHYVMSGNRASTGLNGYLDQNGTSANQPLLKDHTVYNNVPNDDEDLDCMRAMGRNAVYPMGGMEAYNCIPPSGHTQRHSPDRVNFNAAEYASTTLFPSNTTYNGAGHLPPSVMYHSPNLQVTPSHFRYPYNLQIIPGHMTTSNIMDSSGRYSAPASGSSGGGLSVQIPPPLPLPRLPADNNIQGMTGTSVYCLGQNSSPTGSTNGSPNSLLATQGRCAGDNTDTSLSTDTPSSRPNSHRDTFLPPLPSVRFSRLHLLERLGGGQYGEVHLAQGMGDALLTGDAKRKSSDSDKTDPSVAIVETESRRLVAVKVLRKDASDTVRREFQQEIHLLSRLCDSHIAGALGICTEGGSLCVLVEYTKYGDLHSFLRNRRLAPQDMLGQSIYHQHQQGIHNYPQRINDMEATDTLSYGCLIYLAGQIASGMKYLESLGLVHRDLACRNCLVGPRFSIKISDLAMCQRFNSRDYWRGIDDSRSPLPVRWMAWESLLLGKYSTKSDVWAFATTLWELLTFARHQPLDHLTNEQVIENCARSQILHDQPPSPLLSYQKPDYPTCPNECPKEIYDLMQACWQPRDVHRPAFSEIYVFLRRNNVGFNPEEEYQATRLSGDCTFQMRT